MDVWLKKQRTVAIIESLDPESKICKKDHDEGKVEGIPDLRDINQLLHPQKTGNHLNVRSQYRLKIHLFLTHQLASTEQMGKAILIQPCSVDAVYSSKAKALANTINAISQGVILVLSRSENR